jgi:hypothetical protein
MGAASLGAGAWVVAAAVAVGAVAGVSDTASQAVADAYRKLKDLVSSHIVPSNMESPERQLNSAARVLIEDLQHVGVKSDQRLLAAAQTKLAVVRAPEDIAGVERVSAAALRKREIASTGAGPGGRKRVRSPDGPDIHLAIEFCSVRMDFVACLTAAIIFVCEVAADRPCTVAVESGHCAGFPACCASARSRRVRDSKMAHVCNEGGCGPEMLPRNQSSAPYAGALSLVPCPLGGH